MKRGSGAGLAAMAAILLAGTLTGGTATGSRSMPVRTGRLTASPPLTAADLSRPPVRGTWKSDLPWAAQTSVAHSAGGDARHSSRALTARSYSLGVDAWEPTLGVTRRGHAFYAAYQSTEQVDVIRSKDRGRTWKIVSPKVGSANAHVSLDPYLYVDETTSRVFTVDLYGACSMLSFTDNGGESWVTNPFACGHPVNDHQSVFSGHPVTTTTVGYENVVYYCFNHLFTSVCSKSLDGGISFVPTGTAAFERSSRNGQDCTGLHGHGVADASGKIYLPRELCGEPWLAFSKDEGLSWTRVKVAGNGVAQEEDSIGRAPDPAVDVDERGTVYYAWIGRNEMPYLSASRNGGRSWSRPLMVAPPRVKRVSLLTISVGTRGRVAFAYMGTERAKPKKKSQERFTKWNGYVTTTTTALDPRPLFHTAQANPDRYPLRLGACGVRRCDGVGDFLDVQIGRDGSAWAAFVNDCADDSCGPHLTPPKARGTGVVSVVSRPRLR